MTTTNFATIAFTDEVRRLQSEMGSRDAYAAQDENPKPVFGPDHRAFIAMRDSFYLGTVNEQGWPHVQHRGGPGGFLRVLNDTQFGFADYAGNRQYVSWGNLNRIPKAALFLMDYPSRTRLKILAYARVMLPEEDPPLADFLAVTDYRARVERLFVFELAGMSWNCSQHITPRWSEAQIDTAVAPLRARIAELEAQLATRDQPGGA